jgi:formylglycine-generating enzyme required for sulfatase activity
MRVPFFWPAALSAYGDGFRAFIPARLPIDTHFLMTRLHCLLPMVSLSLVPTWVGAQAPDFVTTVKPILEAACVHCHCEAKAKGDLRLDTKAEAFKPIDGTPMIVPGKPEESKVYTSTLLAPDHDDLMPPAKDGPALAPEQTGILKAWITTGATWPEGVTLTQQPRVAFVRDVQPILEQNCVSCHNAEKTKGGLDLSTKELAFKGGEEKGAGVTPFNLEKSSLYALTLLPKDDDSLMPPQGAPWPEGLKLKAQEKKQDRPPNPDNFALVQKIHALIVEKSAADTAEAAMKAFTTTVPKTGAVYEMLPIKGGEFLMGSPETEKHRNPDEGPQTKVKVAPFWMGKLEVTWNEYLPFQITPIDRYKDGARKTPNPADPIVDVVSSPTTPYTEMSFGMGQETFPAIAMTEHGALKYCEWLSAQTGHFYRLPTEAEWEYACRAGTTTAYSFGDDDSKLGDYAWFYDNSPDSYQKTGTKLPNPWGLHDMHGNVIEWTLDAYDPQGYQKLGGSATNPWTKLNTLWGRVARGGSWNDGDPTSLGALRSAARRVSKEGWKQQDPQLPKSMWYLTDTKWLGFRLVRPLRIPSAEEMFYIWNCGRPEQLPALLEVNGVKTESLPK